MPRFTSIDPAYRQVLALTVALFLSYLTVAMSLSAIPVYVVQELGFENVYGGLAVGIAFLSTILTRASAGSYSDRIGGKLSMQRGLLIYTAAGLVCLFASWTMLSPRVGYAILIIGRLLLGLGESAAMVGMIGWAIGLMGQHRSGRVISLVGVGIYGAFAAGGPLGIFLLDRIGFGGLMAVCTVLPLVGLIAIQSLPAVAHDELVASFFPALQSAISGAGGRHRRSLSLVRADGVLAMIGLLSGRGQVPLSSADAPARKPIWP